MAEHRLKVPLDEEGVRSLKVGDTVWLSGTIYTARDEAHRRLMEENPPWASGLKDGAIYHCGPLVIDLGGTYRLISAGPTTSSRMNSLAPGVMRKYGVRVLIGKGGMDNGVSAALRELGGVYLALAGGAGALAASRLVFKAVHYLDLGMPEAVWILEARELGPMTVAMDSHGGSIYSEVKRRAEKRLKELL